jgi:hypothetical protein
MSRDVIRALLGGHRPPAPPAGTVVEQRHGFEIRLRDRQRQHDDVEVSAGELVDQHAGLRLAQFDLQLRILLLQFRQHARQDIRREGRNDAEREFARQDRAAVPGEVDEIARRREQLAAARHDLVPDFRQHDLARAPLDQLRGQLLLELADLHGQRRLGDGTRRRGPAKMPLLANADKYRSCFRVIIAIR